MPLPFSESSKLPLQIEPIAITGWGVVSPIGIGVESFLDGIAAGRSGRKTLSGLANAEEFPISEACTISEFDASNFLGKKGTRFLDRTTKLAVSTVGMALQHSELAVTSENQARIGIVLGTNVGSVKSVCDFMRDTLVHDRPYLVNPMHFPNSVMNCASRQAAIWHKLKGVNSTISGGRLAGLLALRYSGLMIRLGYADAILTGSVEEFCEQTAWGFYHSGRIGLGIDTLLGEGCAVFMLEKGERASRDGRRILGEVLACEVGMYNCTEDLNVTERAQGLANCIKRAMQRSSVSPNDIGIVSLHHWGDPILRGVEKLALSLAVPKSDRIHSLAVSQWVGDCYSAAGSLQLAALLAFFERSNEQNKIGLVTSLAHSGGVGCAVIRAGSRCRQ